MKWALFPFCFLLSIFSSASETDKLEGKIKVLGSSMNQYVALSVPGQPKSKKLCKSQTSKDLRSFVNLKVQVVGVLQSKCFEVTHFEVLAMPSGKKPLIGTLSKEKEGFSFVESTGKKIYFHRLPPVLKRHLNKKLLLDAQITTANQKSSMKLVSFIIHP